MPEEPRTVLRGARVDVDPRLAGRVAGLIGVAALLASAVVLFVIGAHYNSQVQDLKNNGVTVKATSTGCLGLLGGSGSNGAGYTCTGTYVVGGHRYHANLPGTELRPPGSTVQLVVASDDPALLSTPATLATEQASASAFAVPSVLAGAGLVAGGGLWWRLGRQRRGRRARDLLDSDERGTDGGV